MAFGLNGNQLGGARWDGLPIGNTYPFACGCWVRKPTGTPTALQIFLMLNASNASASVNQIGLGLGTGNTINFRMCNNAGVGDTQGIPGLPLSANTWMFLILNCISNVDQRVHTATREPTSSDNKAPIDMADVNFTRIGICGRMHNLSGSRNYFMGDVGDPCVWRNTLIPQSAVVAMANGLSPMQVLPEKLCFFNPTLGMDPVNIGPNWFGSGAGVVSGDPLLVSAAPPPRIQHHDFI